MPADAGDAALLHARAGAMLVPMVILVPPCFFRASTTSRCVHPRPPWRAGTLGMAQRAVAAPAVQCWWPMQMRYFITKSIDTVHQFSFRLVWRSSAIITSDTPPPSVPSPSSTWSSGDTHTATADTTMLAVRQEVLEYGALPVAPWVAHLELAALRGVLAQLLQLSFDGQHGRSECDAAQHAADGKQPAAAARRHKHLFAPFPAQDL